MCMENILIGTNKFNCNLCKCSICENKMDKNYCGGCYRCKLEHYGITESCLDYRKSQ